MMKQKAEIIIEIEESVTIKSRRGYIGLCRECRRLTEMLATEAAAALFALSEREIFRLIESAELHFTEAERVFVCRNSLVKRMETPVLTGKD